VSGKHVRRGGQKPHDSVTNALIVCLIMFIMFMIFVIFWVIIPAWQSINSV